MCSAHHGRASGCTGTNLRGVARQAVNTERGEATAELQRQQQEAERQRGDAAAARLEGEAAAAAAQQRLQRLQRQAQESAAELERQQQRAQQERHDMAAVQVAAPWEAPCPALAGPAPTAAHAHAPCFGDDGQAGDHTTLAAKDA